MVTEEASLNVNGLLERVMTDPVALVERILHEVLDQLAQKYAFGGDGGEPPEEAIATALGNRLAQMIVSEDASAAAERAATDNHREELTEYEELVDRNTALATALGACDCWGQHVDCLICHGAGGPGWALPDKRLFGSYVHPAVRAVTERDAELAGALRRNEPHRKESGDV
jgi:hypothetical protein